jgi:hypothetical protein
MPIDPNTPLPQSSDPSIPGLYQMAMGGAGGADGNDWAPAWVREQLPANLAYWSSLNEGAPTSGPDYGGAFADMSNVNRPLGSDAGKLASYYNPNNWGPPPAITEPLGADRRALGYFPSQFAKGGSDPNDKFWTQKALLTAYNQAYPGGQTSGMDERPNTRNSRLLGGGPGDFMFLGHHINQGKMRQDFLEGTDYSASGVSRPRMGFSTRYGPEMPATFSYGNLMSRMGLPGQLEPWATGW